MVIELIMTTFGLVALFRLTLIDPYNPNQMPSGFSISKATLTSMVALILSLWGVQNNHYDLGALAGSFAVGSVVTTAIMHPIVLSEAEEPSKRIRFLEGIKGSLSGSVMKTLFVGFATWLVNLIGWSSSMFSVSLYIAAFSIFGRLAISELMRESTQRDRTLVPLAIIGATTWVMLCGGFLSEVTAYTPDYFFLVSLAAFWLGSLLNG